MNNVANQRTAFVVERWWTYVNTEQGHDNMESIC